LTSRPLFLSGMMNKWHSYYAKPELVYVHSNIFPTLMKMYSARCA